MWYEGPNLAQNLMSNTFGFYFMFLNVHNCLIYLFFIIIFFRTFPCRIKENEFPNGPLDFSEIVKMLVCFSHFKIFFYSEMSSSYNKISCQIFIYFFSHKFIILISNICIYIYIYISNRIVKRA